jgi:transcriptional regulator with XRE-family HTH domain
MLLKELLKSKGIKQNWLATKMGVSEVTVSSWCAGKSVPKKEHLKRLSELMDVNINTLIHPK